MVLVLFLVVRKDIKVEKSIAKDSPYETKGIPVTFSTNVVCSG